MSERITIARLDTVQDGFAEAFASLIREAVEPDEDVVQRVSAILADVRRRGDQAVLDYTARYDDLEVADVDALRVSPARLRAAYEGGIAESARTALSSAVERIRAYHEKHRLESWSYEDDSGNLLGQQVRPLELVGVYAPGGKAAYPSSILMGVIPAHVAGVEEIVLTVPAPGGELNPLVLAAAHISGVSQVFTIGGAQAIAALAFGTETVPAVDKIVGPGNIYVATAKKLVFGTVGIDMVAGPSEIVVVCDGNTPVEWITMDLFSQAEHDEQARAILICPDAEFLDQVEHSIAQTLPEMERREIIGRSLQSRGALIKVSDLAEAVTLVNQIAPEHLELSIDNPRSLLPEIRHAGAIFLGRYSAEVLGDYCAGPNHVLPTAGTARFSSPLGVYDFQKRSSVIECSAQGADELGKVAAVLARSEKLTAHARAAELRLKS
jgi:histidinol dehydrogenase